MILTAPFQSPADAAEFFNAPANTRLRLVNVLPPEDGRYYTAIYEDTPANAPLEAERLRLLEAKITALWQAPAERKRGMNYPEAIIGEALVPLSVVSNRLGFLVPFRGMTPRARAEWVRDHLDIVGCAYLDRHEARAQHGCAAELIRIEC